MEAYSLVIFSIPLAKLSMDMISAHAINVFIGFSLLFNGVGLLPGLRCLRSVLPVLTGLEIGEGEEQGRTNRGGGVSLDAG